MPGLGKRGLGRTFGSLAQRIDRGICLRAAVVEKAFLCSEFLKTNWGDDSKQALWCSYGPVRGLHVGKAHGRGRMPSARPRSGSWEAGEDLGAKPASELEVGA